MIVNSANLNKISGRGSAISDAKILNSAASVTIFKKLSKDDTLTVFVVVFVKVFININLFMYLLEIDENKLSNDADEIVLLILFISEIR